MKKIVLQTLTILCLSVLIIAKTNAQNVGINATGALPDASAMLHVDAGTSTTKGLLVTGTNNASGTVPDLGAGSRLMFYPAKGAFRTGYVAGTLWDNVNVGLYSVSMGNNTQARGSSSNAMGNGTIALATNSTAMGQSTTATGQSATAMGIFTTASGNSSTAMGNNSVASGSTSTAMGNNTVASGGTSTAMGNITTASGANSTAMGNNVSTASQAGAFVIGDNSTVTSAMTSTAVNQMSMRFAGGYRLFSTLGLNFGVTLAPGGGAWAQVSDKSKKENFVAIDAEVILKKVSVLPLSKWNYKSQPASQKHVGPMAQDFYAAFQLDGIGNDTTINTGDIDGINMAAIQALEKRTADLKNENESLKTSLDELQKKFAEQQKLIEQILIDTKKQK